MPPMPDPQWPNLTAVDETTRTITVNHELFARIHKLAFIQQSFVAPDGVRFKVANRYNFQECVNYVNDCLEEKEDAE